MTKHIFSNTLVEAGAQEIRACHALVGMAVTVLAEMGADTSSIHRVVDLTIGKSNDPVGDAKMIDTEIGDVVLSIFNLADGQPLGLDRIMPLDTHESQASVCAWCRLHYPGETLFKQAMNLLEETVELALVVGVEATVLLAAVHPDATVSSLCSHCDPAGTDPAITPHHPLVLPNRAGRLLYDMLVGTVRLGRDLGLPASAALDRVMRHNRTQSVEYSLARSAHKQALGLLDPSVRPTVPMS